MHPEPLTAGFQEFTAPVESAVKALQFTVFAECVRTIAITAPSGAVVEGTKFSSGRVAFVEAPEPGIWRVKLAGTGYFSAIAQGRSALSFSVSGLAIPMPAQEQSVTARLYGPVASAEFLILARNGSALKAIPMTESATGDYQGKFLPPAEPFRIAVEGTDSEGRSFRRVHAPLFEAK